MEEELQQLRTNASSELMTDEVAHHWSSYHLLSLLLIQDFIATIESMGVEAQEREINDLLSESGFPENSRVYRWDYRFERSLTPPHQKTHFPSLFFPHRKYTLVTGVAFQELSLSFSEAMHENRIVSWDEAERILMETDQTPVSSSSYQF